MPIPLDAIVKALDAELRLDAFDDVSHNGLQVANRGGVSRICCGVDASLDFLRAAKAKGADFCFVHHGISWGDSLARITGLEYRIVSFLIENDMALYAAHLPLDAHPTLGNNARLAAAIGLVETAPCFTWHGNVIGVRGDLPEPLGFEALGGRVRTLTPGGGFHALPFGKPAVRSVGIVSGGASGEVRQAVEAGLDCFITGEVDLASWNFAKDAGINMIAAGHYATEAFGPRAVAAWLADRFALPVEWIDFGLPW
ncbi:MAG: Nif3-like dinuclear metal center hexameric protein [Kiritimatiellia bacterium]|jgi:dinuclear metal center YbgI/SA1388 family protein